MQDNPTRRAGDIPLIKLGHQQCRFPVHEDPEITGRYLFCGKQTSPERVYCDHHHSIVTAVEPRKPGPFRYRNQLRAA